MKVYAFHSIQGGVGRTSIAWMVAATLRAAGNKVLLLEVPGNGTSIVDAVPLQAPNDSGGLYSEKQTSLLLREGNSKRTGGKNSLSFLDDILFWEKQHTNPVLKEYLWWSADKGFFILPASPFPAAAQYREPFLRDESYGGWLEGRMEKILAMIVEHFGSDVILVLDCPAGFHAWSAIFLSLGMRLPNKEGLSTDSGWSGTPRVLQKENIAWRMFLVCTSEMQGLLAIDRWLKALPENERNRFRIILNRDTEAAQDEQNTWFRIPQAEEYRFFTSPGKKQISMPKMFLSWLEGK